MGTEKKRLIPEATIQSAKGLSQFAGQGLLMEGAKRQD